MWFGGAIIAASIVAIMAATGYAADEYLPAAIGWFTGLGVWAPIVFVAGFTLAAIFLVPGSALKMASGALFGLGLGTAYAFAGSLAGSVAAFLIARHGGRRRVQTWLEQRAALRALDGALGAEGWKAIALMRLSPLVPYSLINYVLGLSQVRFSHYVFGAPAMLPSLFGYVYVGALTREVVATARGSSAKSITEWVLWIGGLAATLWLAQLLTRKSKALLETEQLDAKRADDVAAQKET